MLSVRGNGKLYKNAHAAKKKLINQLQKKIECLNLSLYFFQCVFSMGSSFVNNAMHIKFCVSFCVSVMFFPVKTSIRAVIDSLVNIYPEILI